MYAYLCVYAHVGTWVHTPVCTYVPTNLCNLKGPYKLCVCAILLVPMYLSSVSLPSLSLSILSGWDRFCQHGGPRMTVVPEGCRLDQRRHGGRFRPQAGRKTIAHRTDSHEC